MSKPRIVIVEDNPGDVDVLRIALDQQEDDYELMVLRDGAEALQYVEDLSSRLGEAEPCAMLLDVHLPKYDGLEVLEAVKNAPGLRHVHVIMLASGGTVLPREEATIRKWDAIFREKPRSFTEVVELAGQVMDLCKHANPARRVAVS